MPEPSLAEQLDRVKQGLHSLPAELDAARRAVSDRRKAEAEVAALVKDLEAETLMVVSGETTETGKPLFSNKESREAEVRNRLRASDAYRQLKRQLDEAETGKLNAEMQLNQLQDQERALDRTLDAICHQVRADSVRELAKTVLALTALEAKRMAGMGA